MGAGSSLSTPTLTRRPRTATVAHIPITAQIIHDGKYDPRMFRDGAELQPDRNIANEPITTHVGFHRAPREALLRSFIGPPSPDRGGSTNSSASPRSREVIIGCCVVRKCFVACLCFRFLEAY